MIQALLDYQKVDAQLREIEKKLSASEERKKAVSAKKYLDGVEENVNKLDARAEVLIATYESVTAEQLKLKEEQNAVSEALNVSQDEKEIAYLYQIKKQFVIDNQAHSTGFITDEDKKQVEETINPNVQ